QRRADMVREHEHRRVIRRLVAPPAFPAVVGPRTSDGAEHIAPENPGADVLESLGRPVFIPATLSVPPAVHATERACMKKPIKEFRAADTERVLYVLVQTGAEPVDGNGECFDDQSRHVLIMSVKRHFSADAQNTQKQTGLCVLRRPRLPTKPSSRSLR